MMRVRNHGGQCCGIKHIQGFPCNPSDKVAALPVRAVHQGATAEMNAGTEYYPGPRPVETGLERLDELLKYIDARKPQHLVEVTLSYCVTAWKKELLKRGFKVVSVFKNSNTDSTVTVFHRITPLKKKTKKGK